MVRCITSLELVQGIARERLARGRSLWVEAEGRMLVQDQDRFGSAARRGERIQIGEIEPGIAVGKTKLGSGIIM
jgi:hypothetical protein